MKESNQPTRHAFVPYKKTPYCGQPLDYGARCGLTERASAHLSDDVVDDRRVPFATQPTPDDTISRRWDKSGLKEACQRGLAIGRTRQEFDLQLLLDMLLEIERLESAQPTEYVRGLLERLTDLPLLVPGSPASVFQAVRGIQEDARKVADALIPGTPAEPEKCGLCGGSIPCVVCVGFARPAAPDSPGTQPKCVKCGHRATVDGVCQVGVDGPLRTGGYKPICGCKCEFAPDAQPVERK